MPPDSQQREEKLPSEQNPSHNQTSSPAKTTYESTVDEGFWSVYRQLAKDAPKEVVICTGGVVFLCLICLLVGIARWSGFRIKGSVATGSIEVERQFLKPRKVTTDKKGNVKPPQKDPAIPVNDSPSDGEESFIMLFFGMRYEALNDEEPLKSIEEKYKKIRSIIDKGEETFFSSSRVEAEYLAARFKAGDSSALTKLEILTGPNVEAYDANGVLADYYFSINEFSKALELFDLQLAYNGGDEDRTDTAIKISARLCQMKSFDKARALIDSQMALSADNKSKAKLWIAYGDIFEKQNIRWRKHLCYEKALTLTPNDTILRFQLAYSYGDTLHGQAMAAYHYGLLRDQSPTDSTVANNLSIIYANIEAEGSRIALLYNAQKRKDSTYVSANLARAYAEAGFIDLAKEALTHIKSWDSEQQIVRQAYRSIENRLSQDKSAIEKLEQAVAIQREIFNAGALKQLSVSPKQLQESFVGSWRIQGEETYLHLEKSGEGLKAQIQVATKDVEKANYKDLKVNYEFGLLQITGALDESSIIEKPTDGIGESKGLLGRRMMARSLLFFDRPPSGLKLILIPIEEGLLSGVKMEVSESDLKSDSIKQMLDSKKVELTKLPVESKLASVE